MPERVAEDPRQRGAEEVGAQEHRRNQTLATARRVAAEISRHPTEFVSVHWSMFEHWFATVWQPGMHVALVGPTGEGKSTFAVGILRRRKWVLALDPKGEDETLSASGFERITRWPLSGEMWDRVAEGLPLRLIVGGATSTNKELADLVKLMRQALEGVRASGGFTLYADEFQILADRRMYGLDKEVEIMLVAARSKGTSVVTSFQAMSWVPKAATRQASFVVIWPTRDEDMIKAVAQTMGRRWQEIVAAVHELPDFHVLVIPKKVSAPIVITTAPQL